MQESIHVQALATQAKLQSDWVVRLSYSKFPDGRALSAAIQDELKWGRTVVLEGHPYEPATIEVDSLESRFHFLKKQHVIASG